MLGFKPLSNKAPFRNILALPFRRSTHLSLASTIRQYINTQYDQHPDMFKRDLAVIDDLRRDAVNVREAHPSGIAKLQTYAGQLVWIGGKFPIDVSGRPFHSSSCLSRVLRGTNRCCRGANVVYHRLAPNSPGTLRLGTI